MMICECGLEAIQLWLHNKDCWMKSLKKVYKQLPYIIYKTKYLIPQPPHPSKQPTFNYQTPFAYIQRNHPYLINDHVYSLYLQNNQKQLIDICFAQHKKKNEEIKQKLKQYREMYIQPLKPIPRGFFPAIFYYRDNKEKILKIMPNIFNFKVILKEYSKLDDAQKKNYEEKCQQAVKDAMKRYVECANRCMIPQRTFVQPYILYLRETVDGPLSTSMYSRYSKLSKEQKEHYVGRVRQMRENDMKALSDFLSLRQLNIHQFNYIKSVCQKFTKCKKELKKERKLRKLHANTEQAKLLLQQNQIQNPKKEVAKPRGGRKDEPQQKLLGDAFQEWMKQMDNDERQLFNDSEDTSEDFLASRETFTQIENMMNPNKSDKSK